ncbi:MAG: hypothetical protein AB8G86_00135 [Saprospiraceae bacterium]
MSASTINLEKICHFEEYKNGKVKIKYTLANEANLYRYLFDIGIRREKPKKGKAFYTYEQAGKNEVISFHYIRRLFYDKLQNETYPIPYNFTKHEILNFFLGTNTIKRNDLFYAILEGQYY